MRRVFKILLPLLVLALSAGIGVALMKTAPEAKRRPIHPMVPMVETLTVQPRDYAVLVYSRGTVTPRTQGALVAEVAGRIVQVGASFRPGGFFEQDDLLAVVDEVDYRHAVTIAKAELSQARLALSEEEARVSQARRDWEKLGLKGNPGALALRGPQLERAQAALDAAQARLAQAERDLERTRILAPYAGRVLEKQVDVGQYVARGAPLAMLYAVDHVEVRLPITDAQAGFLDLPEHYRGESAAGEGPAVQLSVRVGTALHQWQGRIVRTEGAIDTRTRQRHVVARVDDPYHRDPQGTPPLKVGQFVKAAIQGRTLPGVFVIPREALRQGAEVLVLTPESRVVRRTLEIVWQDEGHVVASGGVSPGEQVVLTPLPYAPDGMQVTVRGAKPGPPGKPRAGKEG